jgi:hypothetical protein
MTACRICSSRHVRSFSQATVLGRHDIAYFRCSECGFICTEEPFWLDEAYADAITSSDVGLVQRNIRLAGIAEILIRTFFGCRGKFLDYAGGYGLFVRLMRDRGLDFRWYDRYCSNLFAKGFAGPADGAETYRLLTAFEVFEHLVDPLDEIGKMLTLSRSILFTTELIPPGCPKPDEWWYYGPEHGQHVSFYTKRSLEVIAARYDLHLASNGKSMHLLSDRKVSPVLFYLLARYRAAAMLNPLLSGRSLLPDDFAAVSSRELR